MNNKSKSTSGAWIQAIGTTISAIGSTPSSKYPEELLNALDMLGNILQGTGNALIADSIDNWTLNKIGNQIQTIGNSTIVMQYLIDFNKEKNTILEMKGDLLQAIGGGLNINIPSSKYKPSPELIYAQYGNFLQIIGNIIQTYSGSVTLKGENQSQKINAVGSWIQAIGALVSAI